MSKRFFWIAALLPLFWSCSKSDDIIDSGIIDGIENPTSSGLSEKRESKPFVYEFDADDILVQSQLKGWEGTVMSELYTPVENMVFSPLSLQVALSMVANGASEEGRAEIASIFQLQESEMDEMNGYMNRLLTGLKGGCDPNVILALENSVWLQKGLSVKPLFEQNMKEIFGTGIKLVDFKGNPSAARNEINKWADSSTHGLIKELSTPIAESTKAVLANATFFSGKWSFPFQEKNTKKELFKNALGQQVQVDMMNRVLSTQYFRNDKYELATLPYGMYNFKMLIALPNEGTNLKDIIGSIDWTANMNIVELYLGLPKFEVNSSLKVEQALKNLGVTSIFKGLPQISNEDIMVSSIIQDAAISVDEEGSKAAAVTTIAMDSSSGIKFEKVAMTVNRPFAFAILDRETGSVLFEGFINQPK